MNEELYVCVNEYTIENIEIIKKLAKSENVVNIVTENNCFFNLEKEFEKQDIFITVSKNKRRALKKASLIFNIDFDELKKYNLNRDAKIINFKEKLELPKSYEGKVVKRSEIITFLLNNLRKIC